MWSKAPTWVAVGLFLGLASLAQPATFTVTTDADSGAGSLREAITSAEANGQADQIDFAADYTIVLASTLPTITTAVTIKGNGWNHTVIDGGNPPRGSSGVRAFTIASGGSLTLDDVMIRNCYSAGDGGAVYSDGGTLQVLSSSLEDNKAVFYGGAIAAYSGGNSFEIRSSHFEGNSGQYWGADVAVWQSGGTLQARVIDTSFVNAQGDSAILIQGVDDVVIDGSTVSGASSSGLLLFGSSGSITNSTFSDNANGVDFSPYGVSRSLTLTGVTIASSTQVGLIVEGFQPQVSLYHSIIAGSGTSDCGLYSATLISFGYNLDSDGSCGLAAGLGDLVAIDPLLGPLQDNGGLTFTREPLPASPVIDAGAADCGLAADQRGAPRPLDGDHNGVALCDIGAVEVGLIFADGFESGGTSYWSAAQ